MEWIEKLDGSVIVSDLSGKVIYANDTAVRTFVKPGEQPLPGRDLMECHNDHSQKIISTIMEQKVKNVYTIEKKGKKKLIYQTPWVVEGELKGLVELSLEIPFDMPHFVREYVKISL
ncbi:MAG: PAS domain-containing protein [Bacteroidetes bacterium]|nr:PAS domain-containing protein [Bacteroidota bacterium]